MNHQNSIIPTDAQHDAHFHPRCSSCDEPFGLVKPCKLTHLDKNYCHDCAPDYNPCNAPHSALPYGARFLTEVELDYYQNTPRLPAALLLYNSRVFDPYKFHNIHIPGITFCLLDFTPNPYHILNTYNTAAQICQDQLSGSSRFLSFTLSYPTYALPRDPAHLLTEFQHLESTNTTAQIKQ